MISGLSRRAQFQAVRQQTIASPVVGSSQARRRPVTLTRFPYTCARERAAATGGIDLLDLLVLAAADRHVTLSARRRH